MTILGPNFQNVSSTSEQQMEPQLSTVPIWSRNSTHRKTSTLTDTIEKRLQESLLQVTLFCSPRALLDGLKTESTFPPSFTRKDYKFFYIPFKKCVLSKSMFGRRISLARPTPLWISTLKSLTCLWMKPKFVCLDLKIFTKDLISMTTEN